MLQFVHPAAIGKTILPARGGFCYDWNMRMFIWLLSGGVALSAAGAELQFNFGDMAGNGALTNFHGALLGGGQPVAWKILQDEVPSAFAPLTDKALNVSARGVLAQTSQDATDERFPLFVYDGEKFRDFKFTTRFKIVSGAVEQMAGVVFRFQNTSNFYVVRASALGKNVRFYKVVNGERFNPIGPAVDLAPGAWHRLAVQCEGTQISIFLDDRLVMPPLGDNTFTEGKLGFWTKSDAVSYFADATVDYTPIVPAAQALVNSIMQQQPRILGLRIYALGTNDTTSIIASKEPAEVGRPGTEAELAAIRDGTISFGREWGAVLVTLPLHDRNGDYIAAVRLKLKSFFGEMQDTAVTRATMIQKIMETLCTSAEELRK
jgi:hypothetical protein